MSEQLKKVKQLVEMREKARMGGGEKAIEKQHAKGKYTARERIELLLDKGPSTDVWFTCLHRTLPSMAVHFRKPWPRKSARSWTSQ